MRALSVAAALLIILSAGASAATIAEDSFDYAAGELDGESGGTGWTGSWIAVTGRTEIESSGLSCCGGPTPVGDGTSTALVARCVSPRPLRGRRGQSRRDPRESSRDN